MASSALPCSRADVACRARLSKSEPWLGSALIWLSSACGNTIATTSRNFAKSNQRRFDGDLLLTVKAVGNTQADVSMHAFYNEFAPRACIPPSRAVTARAFYCCWGNLHMAGALVPHASPSHG